MKFGITLVEDESMTFFIDDEQVGYVDHDLHGYDGMEGMERMFLSIAKKFGQEVVYE